MFFQGHSDMKISVFVDGANFFFMQKKLGCFADPKKISEKLSSLKDLLS